MQLYHYQIDRYITYLFEKKYDYKEIGLNMITHIPFVMLLFVKSSKITLFVALLIMYSFLHYKTKTEKQFKVVYTKRVYRLLLCLYVLYTLLLCSVKNTPYFIYMAVFLMLVNKEMLLLASFMMYPIEMCIQKIYMMDAKKKLKENPALIKVAVVGSYGKTSSKNILFHFLKENYLCLKSKQSINNKMGNTYTIRTYLKRLHTLFLCEMGSDHVGEIEALMRFIEPQYVLITSIGKQHLSTFKTMENIVYEKMSPLLFLKEEDVAVVNIDNPYIAKNIYMGRCKKITFGKKEDAIYRVQNIRCDEVGSYFEVVYKQEIYCFKTFLLGYFNVMNIVGCIALAHTLHVSFDVLQKLCLLLKPIEHRLQSIQKQNYVLIDNAYNSSEAGFKNTVDLLLMIKKYRIFITPGLIDVLDAYEVHKQLIQYATYACDEIVLVGKRNRKAMEDGLKEVDFIMYRYVDTMEEALRYIDTIDKEDFVVCIENDIDKVLMNHVN